jgi:hypothetical protein
MTVSPVASFITFSASERSVVWETSNSSYVGSYTIRITGTINAAYVFT